MAQSLISRTLRGEAARSRVAGILSQESFDSRRALGRRVCEEFSFFDARGRPQLAGCMKALTGLATTSPEIVLPPPRSALMDRTPCRLESGVPEPVAVPGRLSGIGPVEVSAVADGANHTAPRQPLVGGHRQRRRADLGPLPFDVTVLARRDAASVSSVFGTGRVSADAMQVFQTGSVPAALVRGIRLASPHLQPKGSGLYRFHGVTGP